MAEELHGGHRALMKERFLKEGLDHFDRHQIVEMLLFFGIPRKDTNATAHRLIETFGGLPGVLEAPYEELCRVEGVTANAAVLISFCGQMFRTYYHDKFAAGTILSTVEEAGQYLLPQFLGRREETVYLVCLDNKDKVIAANVVREGSVNAADISARVIVQQALTHNATQVILAHNHPSGFALPSRADISTTSRIAEALRAVDVVLLDHIIVAENDFVSMRETPSLSRMFDGLWNRPELKLPADT